MRGALRAPCWELSRLDARPASAAFGRQCTAPAPAPPAARRAAQRQTRRERRVITRAVAAAPRRPASFADIRSFEEFKAVLDMGVNANKIPAQLAPPFLDFYNNYREAVVGSGVAGADEALVARVMGTIADRVCDQFANPYNFPPYHQRMLAPYDYYAFGQNYVRNLIDFSTSVVGHLDRFDAIADFVRAGHNVVLLANHQTEADPAVWALLLERTHPELATDLIYVAGGRVVEDALCKPFSMGRNLFCVHSKKHLDDVPALREAKLRANRRTLAVMVAELNKGGKLLWVAPSGGRDRPNADGQWAPAAFDPASVELMRQLVSKASPPGHIFPLAMHTGEMMPPPPALSATLGERRLTRFVGTGISAGAELDLGTIVAGIPEADRDARTKAVADAAFAAVAAEYDALEAAIAGGPEQRAGMADVYRQPWLQGQ